MLRLVAKHWGIEFYWVIRWEEEILHGKYAKKPKTYDLMTECIECIEYTKYIGYIGDILDILDIVYTQET